MCRRNELVALDLVVTAVAGSFAFISMIGGVYGMNLKNTLVGMLFAKISINNTVVHLAGKCERPSFCCAGGKPCCICLGNMYQWSNCCVAVCQRHAVCKVWASTDTLVTQIAACLPETCL